MESTRGATIILKLILGMKLVVCVVYVVCVCVCVCVCMYVRVRGPYIHWEYTQPILQ